MPDMTRRDAIKATAVTSLAFASAGLATAGVLIERWLFFAEARHVVQLYYGRQAA